MRWPRMTAILIAAIPGTVEPPKAQDVPEGRDIDCQDRGHADFRLA